jgi:AcrR family transcriptional regulator
MAEGGPGGLTMSGLAVGAGVARATPYRYFPDVASALTAWHEQQVLGHLAHLRHVHDASNPETALRDVLTTYAAMSSTHADAAWAANLHSGEHMVGPRAQLRTFFRSVLLEAVARGEVRDDVDIDVLTGFCLHALAAGAGTPSDPAPAALTTLVLDAICTRDSGTHQHR